ncbi:hypothetical protein C8F04DRAFT_1071268 [Mycena alexandri]|uniref:Uncharacterized protein n=1 Tax=Mycena alexandri TaxID=1745969 RepID=A0AAD6TCF7_9AGAR|nr:hypothetical protein C8F04DRAFT_1071268 [Mycena alexandri]
MSLKSVLAVNMAIVVLESFLYALLLVSTSTTLYLRFSRHDVPKLLVWNPVVLFTVTISITSGAHWILTVVRFFNAFLGVDAVRFYLDHSYGTDIARNLLTLISILIGDAAIIHRLWLIWNLSLPVIIVPVLTWVGFLVIQCEIIYVYAQPVAVFARGASWLKANWILLLVTNVYCTGLIIWKIWKTKRTAEHLLGDGTFVPVLIILLESAAVWTIWGLFFAVATEVGSLLLFIVGDLSPTIVGLVNMAIYLRVELQCTRPQGSDSSGVAMTSSASILAPNIPYYVNRVSAQNARSAT